jgi:hypothetical protein
LLIHDSQQSTLNYQPWAIRELRRRKRIFFSLNTEL